MGAIPGKASALGMSENVTEAHVDEAGVNQAMSENVTQMQEDKAGVSQSMSENLTQAQEEEAGMSQSIVVHEDALDAACQAASRSIDQLLWQGNAETAKAVTLFGPGIVVLPMFGKVCGVADKNCLAYAAHPKRAAKGGLMDRV